MTTWTADDVPAQTGRTVVITGANSGIGRVAAEVLARAGARVVLAVRDEVKGHGAARAMTGRVEVRRLDLSDLSSVRAFAAGWSGPIDVLINNAGVMAVPQRQETADGFERQFGTNHLGHFALTNLLLPAITDRVVTLSSVAHRTGTIVLDDLNWQRRRYRPWLAYGQTKLANLLFTLELQRRLAADRSPVLALAAHPGLASTNLYQPGRAVIQRIGNFLIARAGQSAEMGALPTLYAATADLPPASYVGPDGRLEQKGYPTLVGRTAAASDVVMARKLWAASEELTGVRYPTGLARSA